MALLTATRPALRCLRAAPLAHTTRRSITSTGVRAWDEVRPQRHPSEILNPHINPQPLPHATSLPPFDPKSIRLD